MRLEITPVYEVDADTGAKRLISIRKRVYLPNESMFGEWLLDWATGEWRRVIEMSWNVEINDEMRVRLDWEKGPDA